MNLEAYNRRKFNLHFASVSRLIAIHPVGMMIYALCEMRAEPPYRRFLFGNWDEDDKATLEIEAKEFNLTEEKTKEDSPK